MTFIISLPVVSKPTLIISPAKNEVIPEVDIIVSLFAKLAVRDDVTPVPTIGLWIILSIDINALVFWFLLIKLCEDPIPTEVRFKGTAIDLSASSADLASLTKLSLTLIMKALSGIYDTVVIPVGISNAVLAIPIESVVAPTPVVVHPTMGCLIRYSTSSPVTKKWLGILIVSFVKLTTSVLDPSKSFLNIWLVSFSIGKPVLAPKKVPSYTSNLVWIEPDCSSIEVGLLSSWTLRAWINVLTSTAVFAFGTYDISVKQSDPSLLPPIVPIPIAFALTLAPVMIFPYSVIITRVSSSIIMISENSYLSFVVSLTWTKA